MNDRHIYTAQRILKNALFLGLPKTEETQEELVLRMAEGLLLERQRAFEDCARIIEDYHFGNPGYSIEFLKELADEIRKAKS